MARRITWRQWLAAAVFLVGLAAFAWAMSRADYTDAASYHAAFWRDGIYADAQLAGPFVLDDVDRGRGYVYPPSSLLFLAPFAVGPWAFPIISLAATALLVAVVLLIVRQERGLTWPVALVIAGVTVALYPTVDAAESGQINGLVAAAFGVAWLRPSWSGWLGVAGGLVKLFPGALLFWAFRRRAPLVAPIVAGVAAVALSAAVWGVQAWLDYAVVVQNAEPSCNIMARLSVTCLVGSQLPGYVLAALLLVGSLLVRRDDEAFALLGLAMWAAAPDVWPHYWLVPMIGFLPFALRRIRSRNKPLVSATS